MSGLRVVGAGFGRTGTLTLKNALQVIGYGPCYHMMEVFPRREHIDRWCDVTFDGRTDWDALFAGFRAAVDWPAARWWRELAAHYPEAKVVLTVRDPEEWYASMRRTIYPEIMLAIEDEAPPFAKRLNQAVRKMIVTDTFGDRFEDRDFAVDRFRRHIDEVREAIDPSRLLIYDVREGWSPLCDFFAVPIPEAPFPRENQSGRFPVPTGGGPVPMPPPGHFPAPGDGHRGFRPRPQ